MAVRVRVKNFQSIADSTVEISGLTVVTGQNNSGKSALIRAIAAMATNESAKGLLRNGEKTLSVELWLPDGTEVKWEKGGTTNQYTLNGKVFSGVGSGVPEEIKALGLGPVEAGGQEIWPQVASQFKGSLFLLDKSGAVFAEAVSDVERVGLLAEASRKAESDARSAKSEHKVRQKDVAAMKDTLRRYDPLPNVEAQVQELKALEQKAQKVISLHRFFSDIQQTLDKQTSILRRYSAVTSMVIPEAPPIQEVETVMSLRKQMQAHRSTKARYQGLPEIPEYQFSLTELRELLSLRETSRSAKSRAQVVVPEVNIPDVFPADKFDRFLGLYHAIKKTKQDLAHAESLAKVASSEYEAVSEEYAEVLRMLGTCPTCGADCGETHL